MENPNYKKLIRVLEEVFQLNQADLDFGIYRIMNHNDKSSVQQELDKAIKQAAELGADPENLPKVKALRQQLAGATDIEAEENAVFANLANFFKRYYEGGDFISLRRYKEGVYAIPYEGEEVKLHWANHDQYYIKTSEYLKNYTFKLGNEKSVRFVLVEASTEQKNNKAKNNKERRFALYEEEPLKVMGNELHIQFTYELIEKKIKQEELLKAAFNSIKTRIPSDFQEILVSNINTKTDKLPNRTLLEKHIKKYTARFTFDYFIHKNLGKFLRQELDFFIKNEVLHLDDINTRDTKDFVRQLSQVRALKTIGLKIIAFLEQLEDFQKKLWLKKKFVIETEYCITLDRLPKELHSDIINNTQQVNEWKKLFHIQDIEKEKENSQGALFKDDNLEKVSFSEPLTTAFLLANPFLILDTKFFSEEFKVKLIDSIEDIDEQLSGLLINSNNFHAINLFQERYKKQIKCIYTDPPYNTGGDGFIYKDNFQHSSWLSMMLPMLFQKYNLLSEQGSILISIDENEISNLTCGLKSIFEKDKVSAPFIWKKKAGGGDDSSKIAVEHEYIVPLLKDSTNTQLGKIQHESPSMTAKYSKKEKDGRRYYWERMDKTSLTYSESMDYEVPCPDGTFIMPEQPDPENPTTIWRWSKEKLMKGLEEPDDSNKKVYVRKDKKNNWRVYTKTYMSLDGVTPRSLLVETEHGRNREGTRELANLFGKKIFKNPKPTQLLSHLLPIFLNSSDGLVGDFFAGSSTTGHSIINLNRKDNGNRKYILAEMGEHFDNVTKPRIQKVIYSKDWKDGKPVSREGSSHCFKYIRLESYEDALNNLTLNRKKSQSLALQENATFREGYMLNYMLDTETQDSLLNIAAFEDPFNYYLNITRDNEMKATKVDMVETFNYLIGLVVESLKTIRGFRVVEGHNLKEDRILVIWRNTQEKNNEDLNTFFQKMSYNTRDQEFDRIYVNGDNNLENLRTEEDKWKVVMIEEEFKKRMFDVTDV